MSKAVVSVMLASLAALGVTADAEEPSLPLTIGAAGPRELPKSGIWRVEYDHQLDGKLKSVDSPLLVLSAANNRVSGHFQNHRAAKKQNDSVFAGEVIAGTPSLLALRQDDPMGYTAVYTGRFVSKGKVVGSYADNRGYGGDWSLTLVSERSVAPLKRQLPDEPLLESVLGAYGKAIRGERRPLVNLRPPSRNLWTPEIQEIVSAALPYGEVDYIGTAWLSVPESATYKIDLPGAGVQFRLNGQLLEAGDIHLAKGVYRVEIYTNHWGQPYLTYAEAAVYRKADLTRIPFVNPASEVKEFRSAKIDGRPVVEVCQYVAKPVGRTSGARRGRERRR